MSEPLASTPVGQASAALSAELSALDIANRADKLKTFGLATVIGWVKGKELPLPASAHVEIAGVSADIAGRECFVEQQPGLWRVQFNLMSHLLANGPHTLRVTVEFEDGSSADFPEKRLTIDNATPLGSAVADDLRAFGTPAIFGRIVDSQMFPYGRGEARAWFDDVEPAEVPLSLEPSASVDEAHRHLERWGFCILPDRLPADIIERFSKELYGAIENGSLQYREGSSDRIHNAHTLPAGREIWLHPPVLQFLKEHFRDTPCACQTLTYVNGSEQSAHQDTIHLTPYPAGMMSGVWIALQDVEPDSGELFVYPGSHKTPRLRASELGLEKVDQDYATYQIFDRAIMKLVEDGGFQRVKYQPKAGQILVWHENLIHGGSPRATQDRKRFSIVSHYFAKGSVGYYDSRGEAAALEALPGL
jgi:hypothetical protein